MKKMRRRIGADRMETRVTMKKEFKVYSPLTNKSVERFITKSDDGSDERILLEGIASTTSRDLHDEIVSSAAIESMAEQAFLHMMAAFIIVKIL